MSLHNLKTEYLLQFILGGHSEFVVSQKDTDIHIEFKVTQKIGEEIYFVSYKSTVWVYIGLIKFKPYFDFIPVKVTESVKPDTISRAEVFRKLILGISYLNKLPNNIEVFYTGRCSVCHRKLSDPDYIKIGIGPTCLKNL